MIDAELLNLLCCPETHQALRLAAPAELEQLNRQVTAGQIRSRSGKIIEEPVQAGLVRADGKYLYPIRDEIPIMLIEEAIPLE